MALGEKENPSLHVIAAVVNKRKREAIEEQNDRVVSVLVSFFVFRIFVSGCWILKERKQASKEMG